MDNTNETYKAKLTILTGNPIERADLGNFVIDLGSISFHKDRFSIDFNHNDEIPLGVLENVRYEKGIGLIGQAIFNAPNTNDKASEIIERIKSGYPFEVSPTLDLDSANIQTVNEGEAAEVNGIIVNGPVDIYRNAQFRGCGIVLFGTDPNTSITPLKQDNLLTLHTQIKGIITMKNTAETLPETTTEAQETGEKRPEYLEMLDTMIETFGEEAGIKYFRQGLSIEEAEKEDYAELKAMRAKLASDDDKLKCGENEEEEKPADNNSEPPKPAENPREKEELKAELKELKAEITKLRTIISSRGESSPVSGSMSKAPDTRDALHRMADKIKAQGIKRA